MDIRSEKLLLIELLARVQDKKIIAEIKEILQKDKNPIIGYDVHGRPITKKDYIKNINKAREEIKSGNYITQEELEKHSEDW